MILTTHIKIIGTGSVKIYLIMMTTTFLKAKFTDLHHDISARRARRGKIKTLLSYNSNLSYPLNLLRTWSILLLLRSN